MTITSYDTLKTTVADFLNRDDLTAAIPTFIQLNEGVINRKLRHWKMEKRSTAAINTQYADLPSDWLETIRYSIQGKRNLELLSQSQMTERRVDGASAGEPCYYSLTGGDVEVFPVPDASYTSEMVYFAELPALSDSATSNWLLEENPDVYLYGALLHSAPYLQEDGRIAAWGELFTSGMASLQAASDKARHSGSGLKMR